MDMREDALFVLLHNAFFLHRILQPMIFQHGRDGRQMIAEHMQIDVRPLADMPGQNTADQPRMKRIQQPHQPQRFQPHIQQILLPLVSFVQIRQRPQLLADLRIARQIAGMIPVLHPQLPGGFRFAVKYSDSSREYIKRAASNAILLRIRTSDMS